MIRTWLQKYQALILVTLLAAGCRLWLIDSVPGGLFPDEAANGLDVNLIFKGQIQPFYERSNGREGLFFYFLAPFVAIFGRTPLAHHLVSALVGITVVAFTYLLVRRWFGSRVAFVAAYFTAVSSWYITLSRTAFRANLVPVFTVLFFYLATRVVQARTKRDFWFSSVGAGISFGLGFYTYISYRMMAPLLLMLAGYLFIVDAMARQRFELIRKYGSAIAVAIISALVVITPLGLFFLLHPEWIVGRSGQVSIFSPSLNHGDVLGTFVEVVRKTIWGFLVRGDVNWRHNVAGFPLLSLFVSPFFVAGLGWCAVKAVRFKLRYLPHLILILWFALMLVPEILTAEGIPHGLRLIGVIPVVFVMAAIFIDRIMAWAVAVHRFNLRVATTYLLGGLLFVEGLYGPGLYFEVAAQSPEYARAFRSDLTPVARYLADRHEKSSTYLVIDLFSEQTVQYMTTGAGQPYQIIDPATLWSGPQQVKVEGKDQLGLNLNPGDQVIFCQSTLYDANALEMYYPGMRLVGEYTNKWEEVVMQVYEQT